MSALDGQKAEIQATDQVKDTMKQEPVNPLSLNSVEDPLPSQNGTNGKDNAIPSPEKPIKTEGEASVAENSFIPRSLQLTPTSSAPMASPIAPFAPNLGSLSSQLTPDEQTAAYKKANILALSALAKRGGPNTKDMFAVQQKLQEFLTSLITLAGQKGPQLKVTVQMLVQNLVVSTWDTLGFPPFMALASLVVLLWASSEAPLVLSVPVEPIWGACGMLLLYPVMSLLPPLSLSPPYLPLCRLGRSLRRSLPPG